MNCGRVEQATPLAHWASGQKVKCTPCSSNTFFERSFIYAAPTEWNKLDGHIRKITNFDSFKREIKTTLFLSYFDL